MLREVLANIAQYTDKIRKEPHDIENDDLATNERPLTADYLEGLKNINIGYIPRDI